MSCPILTKRFPLLNTSTVINNFPSIFRFIQIVQSAFSRHQSSNVHSSSQVSKMVNATVTREVVSEITAKEKQLSKQDDPVKDGPTAQAQKHASEELKGNVISDIMQGEKQVTGQQRPVQGGPTAAAQSIAAKGCCGMAEQKTGQNDGSNDEHSGRLDSSTISAVSAAEKKITGLDHPVEGGPTVTAKSHTDEPINSKNLHNITEAEKKVTDGERVKGGPTATAQSELAKSRS